MVWFAALLRRKRPSPWCCSVTCDSLVFYLGFPCLAAVGLDHLKVFFNLRSFVI